MGLIPTLKTFIPNTPILASEVNSNFEAIRTVVNGGIGSVNLEDSSVTTIAIQDGSITSAKIADEAVTNSKLAVDSVDSAQLVGEAVTTPKLGPLSVTGPKIADGAISTDKIDDLQVTAPKLGDLAVITSKLDNGAVTGPKLDNEAVGTSKLEGLAVTNPKLADHAVTERVLAAGAVTDVKLRLNAVTNDKVASGLSASKLTTGTLPPDRIAPNSVGSNKLNFINGIDAVSAFRVNIGGLVTSGSLPSGVTVSKGGTGVFNFSVPTDSSKWVMVVTPVARALTTVSQIGSSTVRVSVYDPDTGSLMDEHFNAILVRGG